MDGFNWVELSAAMPGLSAGLMTTLKLLVMAVLGGMIIERLCGDEKYISEYQANKKAALSCLFEKVRLWHRVPLGTELLSGFSDRAA